MGEHMKTSNIRWASKTLMFATLVLAGAALSSIGCGSDSNNSNGGTGGAGGGAGGAPVVHLVNYTFDTGLQGWVYSDYNDPNSTNLGYNPNPDGGTDDGGAAAARPTIEFDSAVGDPSPGSIKKTVTFTSYGQYIDPIINFMDPKDLTGKTLHARLSIASVSTGNFMGGGQLHVTTGASFAYGSAPIVVPSTTGTFATSSFSLA